MNTTRLTGFAHRALHVPHEVRVQRPRAVHQSRQRPHTARPGIVGGRRIPTGLVLFAMFVGGLCSLLALNTASAAAEVEARSVVSRNDLASDLQQQLERDLALREAPDSLARDASALGLVPNPNPAFLRMNADGSVTVLGQAIPASVPVVPAPPPPPAPVAKPSATPSKTGAAGPARGNPVATTRVTVTVTATAAARASVPARPANPKPTTTGGHG